MFAVAIENPGDLLRKVRESRRPKLTQRDVANLLGINEETYRSYECNRSRLPVNLAKKLAAEWNVPFQAFYGTDAPILKVHETVTPYSLRPEPTGRVKVYNAASAGNHGAAIIDEFEMDVPVQFAREDYGALVVDGDSMMPELHPGDICIFKDSVQPKVNTIVAAELENGDWVIKKLVFEDGLWHLASINNHYEPIRSAFRLTGFLVGMIRDDGPERLIRMNPYGLTM